MHGVESLPTTPKSLHPTDRGLRRAMRGGRRNANSKGRHHADDTSAPRPRPEPLARQHHARPPHDRHAPALHRRIVGDRAHVEPDDLRSGHQGQRAPTMRRSARSSRRASPAKRSSSSWRRRTSGRRPICSCPVFERTDGVDGWVSLEVSPLLAYDTKTTHRRGARAPCAGRAAQPLHQDPGNEGRAARRSRRRSSPACRST